MEKKKEYTKPVLTIVSFKSEKGYASSINLTLWLLSINGTSFNQMESYETANGWTEGNDTFWN